MPRVGMPVPGIDFYDEGVLLARKEQADFAGAGVTGSVSGSKVLETIPGGGGGVTDHGALTGLADDDHTQYMKEEASGGLASEVPDHLHTGAAEAGTLDHGAALTGLTDDDHTQYLKESDYGPGDTVADETTEGIAAAAGASGQASRKDHTHGTGAWVRRLYADYITRSVTGTLTETTLNTYTLPANTLASGKGLRITMGWSSVGGANTRTFRLYFGATVVIQFGETSVGDKLGGAHVFYQGPGDQVTFEWVRRGGSTGQHNVSSAAEDETAAIVIKTTGELANTGDTLLSEAFLVELIP